MKEREGARDKKTNGMRNGVYRALDSREGKDAESKKIIGA